MDRLAALGKARKRLTWNDLVGWKENGKLSAREDKRETVLRQGEGP